MAEAAALPAPAEVARWVGTGLSDIDGKAVGEIAGSYVDSGSGEPVWLIARVGRRRQAKLVAMPLRECAGAAFGVWVAEHAEVLGSAPVVDPSRPLRREHELAICAHYGIGEAVGRAAEVVGRPEGAVTATPFGA
jgi:hypothetical protein